MATNAIRDAGWGNQVAQFFARTLQLEEANGDVGAAWAKQLSYKTGWSWWRAASRLRVKTVAEKEALRHFLNLIGDNKRRWLLSYVIRRFRAAIESDTIAWGNTGYALTNSGAFRRAIRAMDGWKNRSEVQPWMLLNLSLCFARYNRSAEVRDASLAALALPGDHSRQTHSLLLAHFAAVEGNFSEAESYYAQARAGKEIERGDIIAATVEALVELHRTSAVERRTAAKQIRTRLSQKVDAVGRLDPVSRGMYRRALICLAHAGGQALGRARACLRTLPRPSFASNNDQLFRVVIFFIFLTWKLWVPMVILLYRYLRSFVTP